MATAKDNVMPDEDSDEWEEEEYYVLVELSGISHDEFKNSKNCEVIDIDSPSPHLKLDNCIFKGQYKHTVGTAVIFEEGKEKTEDDVPMMNYLCKTVQKLEMERVFLKPKTSASTTDTPSEKLETTDELDEGTSSEDKAMDTG
ncbi:general transcription factor 3C polypeptide 6-like [Antedon mediterranea]|uniref:general transcription factor 3C polypeptide 6-like n=1 Tax=Antedon mediterranea TaxID=105859 RepID=UPI003AF7933A